MTLISIERPGSGLRAPASIDETTSFAAPAAFGVLRAWRAWAARERDDVPSGFLLSQIRTPGAAADRLVLTSENLDADQVAAIGRYSHRRPRALAAPASAAPPATVPLTVAPLRSVDDWTVEMFLRSGEEVCRSLVIALRHREGRFELVTWARADAPDAAAEAATSALLRALASWINR